MTYDDIRSLPGLKGDTIIAVKAPSGTTLTVPDPDEVRICELCSRITLPETSIRVEDAVPAAEVPDIPTQRQRWPDRHLLGESARADT